LGNNHAGRRAAARVGFAMTVIITAVVLLAVVYRPAVKPQGWARNELVASAVPVTPTPTAAVVAENPAPTLVPAALETPKIVAPPVVTTHAPPVAAAIAPRSPAEVGRQALALITYPWQQRLNATINFEGPRNGMRAFSTSYPGYSVVTVYVRPTDTVQMTAVNIAHELGHLIDWLYLTDNDRAQWLSARGRPDATWFTCDGCTDYSTGSGDFAETFAAWQVAPVDYRSRLAPLPSPAEMQQLSRFFK
jgi:hypothetical protein